MAGVTYCYPFFRFSEAGTQLLGIYSTASAAQAAFDSQIEGDDYTLQVEEWPLDELATKFNVTVEASK